MSIGRARTPAARRHLSGRVRWGLVALAALVGIALLLAAAIAAFLRPEAIAAEAARQVRAATGRELAIAGPLSFRLFPNIAVVAHGVTLGNAPWGTRPEMARVERLALAVGLAPLLRGRVEVRSIEIGGVDLLLETDAAGKGNWVFEAPGRRRDPGAGTPADGAPALVVGAIEIEAARIALRDGRTGAVRAFEIARARRELGERSDAIAASASVEGVPLELEGTVGPLSMLVERAADYPVDLAVEAKGLRARARGVVHPAAAGLPFELDVEARVDEGEGLARMLGAALPVALPAELGGRLTRSGPSLALRPLRLSAGGQSLSGSLEWRALEPRPLLVADVQADALDPARLRAAPREAKAAPARPSSGFVLDESPLSLPVPRDLDADLALRIGRLQLSGGTSLTGVQARATLREGTLKVDPLAFGLAGGSATGRLSARETGAQAASVSLGLEARDLRLADLLALAGKPVRVSGAPTSITAKLDATGGSLHDLAASASGEALVRVGPGSLDANALGACGDALAQLLDALNPFKGESRMTDLHCAVARLPVRQGVIHADRSIAFETGRVNAVMSGTIDLRRETLSLAVQPTIKEGLGVAAPGLAQLVRLEGTFRQPRVGIDPAGIARGALSAGAAAATGGASLLFESLLSGAAADPHPCQTALGGRAAARPEARRDAPSKTPKAPASPLPAPLRDLFKGFTR